MNGFTSPSETLCPAPSSLEWAYLAGLFDGEGCIKIVWKKHKHRKHQWQINIDICNTHCGALLWVKSVFGGRVMSSERKATEVNQRRRFHWYCGYNHAVVLHFLSNMQPYLRIKGEQAKHAIEFLKTSHGRGGKGVPLSPTELAQRDVLAKKLRELRWQEWPAIPQFEHGPAVCPVCSKGFVRKSQLHTYCSKQCVSNARAKRERARFKAKGLTSRGKLFKVIPPRRVRQRSATGKFIKDKVQP